MILIGLNNKRYLNMVNFSIFVVSCGGSTDWADMRFVRADSHVKWTLKKTEGRCVGFNKFFGADCNQRLKMTSTEVSMLRDLPQPNLNDTLKSNSYSAIKLLKTGRIIWELAELYLWTYRLKSAELQQIVIFSLFEHICLLDKVMN